MERLMLIFHKSANVALLLQGKGARSVLKISARKTSNLGAQIPEPSLSFISVL